MVCCDTAKLRTTHRSWTHDKHVIELWILTWFYAWWRSYRRRSRGVFIPCTRFSLPGIYIRQVFALALWHEPLKVLAGTWFGLKADIWANVEILRECTWWLVQLVNARLFVVLCYDTFVTTADLTRDASPQDFCKSCKQLRGPYLEVQPLFRIVSRLPDRVSNIRENQSLRKWSNVPRGDLYEPGIRLRNSSLR